MLRCGDERYPHDELASAACTVAVRGHGAAVERHERANQGEPDPEATVGSIERPPRLHEELEDREKEKLSHMDRVQNEREVAEAAASAERSESGAEPMGK